MGKYGWGSVQEEGCTCQSLAIAQGKEEEQREGREPQEDERYKQSYLDSVVGGELMGLSRRRNLFSVTDLMKDNKGEGRRPHREEREGEQKSHGGGGWRREGKQAQSQTKTDPGRRDLFSSVMALCLLCASVGLWLGKEVMVLALKVGEQILLQVISI